MRVLRPLSLLTALLIAACQPQADTPAESNPAAPATETAATQSRVAPQPVVAPEPQASVPEGPDMAPVELPEADLSCRATLGEAAAANLVKRCIAVSPATRPPCNAANTCDLIQGEIDRSCAMYGPDELKPDECTT